MTDAAETISIGEIDPEAVKPIVRAGVIIVGIMCFMILGSILPGTNRGLPGLDAAVSDVVLGVGSLGIVVALLRAGQTLHRLVVDILDGPSAIVVAVGSISKYVVVFVAIVIAHRGFAPLLVPLFSGNGAYDFAFLLPALVPLGMIAYHVYRSLDPISDLLSAALLEKRDIRQADAPIAEDERR